MLLIREKSDLSPIKYYYCSSLTFLLPDYKLGGQVAAGGTRTKEKSYDDIHLFYVCVRVMFLKNYLSLSSSLNCK
jgi:hypothetical protein